MIMMIDHTDEDNFIRKRMQPIPYLDVGSSVHHAPTPAPAAHIIPPYAELDEILVSLSLLLLYR